MMDLIEKAREILPKCEHRLDRIRHAARDELDEIAPDIAKALIAAGDALDEIAGVGFDAPMTWAGTDAEWERHRANIMQAIARKARAAVDPAP